MNDRESVNPAARPVPDLSPPSGALAPPREVLERLFPGTDPGVVGEAIAAEREGQGAR